MLLAALIRGSCTKCRIPIVIVRIFIVIIIFFFRRKTQRAAQTVRPKLETLPMGRPKIEENVSKSQPNRPIGGAIATTDAKRLITPKPLVISSVLYPCNPWLNQNKCYLRFHFRLDFFARHFEICPKPTFAN